MSSSDPLQLNEYVRPILSRFLKGDYVLTPEGQELVITANTQLDKKYALAHDLPIAEWCFHEINECLKTLPPENYGTLLDVCAGTGYVSLNVMRKGLFKECVALDINPTALSILESRANKLSILGITTQSGNIFATEFATDSFDCIMGNAFLHHLPDTESFFREMFRILKPGGVLCLTGEPGVSSMKWENKIQRFLLSLVGKTQKPKGTVPLTDIWQFSAGSVTGLLGRLGYGPVKVAGFGRWSASIQYFASRLLVRFTGRPAPAWFGFVTHTLRKWGAPFFSGYSPDELAAITISARKPKRENLAH